MRNTPEARSPPRCLLVREQLSGEFSLSLVDCSLLQSYQSHVQTDFEEAIYAADSAAEIFTFDFTINKLDPRVANRKEFKFYPWGLGDATKHPIYTLANITAALGHDRIDVLKIDIESAEMKAIPQLFNDPKRPVIDQVLIEVHFKRWDWGTSKWDIAPVEVGIRLFKTFDEAGFDIVSSEWNSNSYYGNSCCLDNVLVRRSAGLLLIQ